MFEAPIVAIKVAVVLALVVGGWLGWAVAGWLAWHHTGRLDYTVLSAMLGLLLLPLSTIADAIP